MSSCVHQPEAPLSEQSALVIFSGGQDSATCLAWALSRFASVQTIGFDYGQRHAVELQCRANVRQAVAAGGSIYSVTAEQPSLEDIYFRLIEKQEEKTS